MGDVRRQPRTAVAVVGCLWVLGLAIAIWYFRWGVHGCNDSITGTSCHERMDRDYALFMIGVVAVLLGAIIGVVAIVRHCRDDDRSGRR